MFEYESTQKVTIKTILVFVLVVFLAYLPVASFQFCLKNDAFSGYLPPKFFMSECLQNGILPLWNPYINFGIPQYGDMSSGFWSPITWLIASTVGYNVYTFTMELLFYILLGGVGMYTLLGYWKMNNVVKFIAAVSFMCSGYNIGNLQHFNWVSGAAFLPWCLWAYLSFLQQTSIKNIIRTAFLFFLLLATAHPGISIASFYLFLFIFIYNYVSQRIYFKIFFKNHLKNHILLVVFFLIFAIGLIVGYADILPYFSRGQQLDMQTTLLNPTTAQSWISLILPFSTTKNALFFGTDISMRNCYFGLVFFIFFLVAIFQKKTGWQKLFLFVGVFFALLSLGGIVKSVLHKVLPGIGFVRLNGEFRILAICCFIFFSAMALEKFISSKQAYSHHLKIIFTTLYLALSAAVCFGMLQAFVQNDSFFYHINEIISQQSIALKLKKLIDKISFFDTLWIQGFIQIIVLSAIRFCLKNNKYHLLKTVVVVELVVASLLNIPFTGVGKNPLKDVQTILNKSPKGLPIPSLVPINNNDNITMTEKGLIGDWSFYNKQIGNIDMAPYPIVLNNTIDFYNSVSTNKLMSIKEHTYLFVSNDSDSFFNKAENKSTITVQNFSPNKITCSITTDTNTNLIYLQNHYPHWYYTIDGYKQVVNRAGINFIKAPIKNGNSKVTFSFEPTIIKCLLLFNLMTLILLIAYVTIKKIKSFFPS